MDGTVPEQRVRIMLLQAVVQRSDTAEHRTGVGLLTKAQSYTSDILI